MNKVWMYILKNALLYSLLITCINDARKKLLDIYYYQRVPKARNEHDAGLGALTLAATMLDSHRREHT